MIALLLLLVQAAPLPPEEAPRRMTVPEGFQVTLFAGEPDVVQPLAFALDERGRLWVVETQTYPGWLPGGSPGKDRILIYEDRDGDGKHDSKKVFVEGVSNLSGIAIGFGGVWLTQVPYLSFIPDRNGDDVPDGPAEILLDGWDLKKSQHNVVNGLHWGPDGWLYGLNGIQSNSLVGKPGAPDAERTFLNCGVWRFHPSRRVFEVVASGTTNPWGLDWDDWGEMFITNCVIKHVWHVLPGAHYQRMYGEDATKGLFGLMESPADHIHWGGGSWTDSRGGKGKHDEAGGGHAHVGAMVYLGDNWPDRYRNTLFTVNLHGNRISNDALERKGSGYVARHSPDLLRSPDPWFRGLELKAGPDGGVYVTDWVDTGECHNYKVADKTNGRIYKVTYGPPKPAAADLRSKTEAELVALHLHKNDWFVRNARRLLQERGVKDAAPLEAILRENPDATRKLRALWTLHAAGALREALLLELLGHPDEHVRSWAVRLAVDSKSASDPVAEKLVAMTPAEPSPKVRLALASAVQRLPAARRWPILEALVAREEDKGDANLPLMIWYGVHSLVATDRERVVALVPKVKIPLIREYIARSLVTNK
jgi:putative membrane-bound dehydrogenase-like protein